MVVRLPKQVRQGELAQEGECARARGHARAYLAAAPPNQQNREMVAHWLCYLEKGGQ